MKRYQAITSTNGTVDIGEFPDINSAQVYALQVYGADLATVAEVPVITINHAEHIDPAWYLLAIAGVLLLLAAGEHQKKNRGRYVR